MEWSFLFFLNSALLGVGLAMDAFSVSMANGLHDPGMSRKRMCIIAGTFGVFQAVMPMTGWVCVHTIVEMFSSFETFIPWIALALLGYIGGKMLIADVVHIPVGVSLAVVGILLGTPIAASLARPPRARSPPPRPSRARGGRPGRPRRRRRPSADP